MNVDGSSVTGGRQTVCWEAGSCGADALWNSLRALVFLVKPSAENENRSPRGSGDVRLGKVRSRSVSKWTR